MRLTNSDGDGVYNGTYTGFDQMGAYRILVYATDEDDLLSRPRSVVVNNGVQLFLPSVMTR